MNKLKQKNINKKTISQTILKELLIVMFNFYCFLITLKDNFPIFAVSFFLLQKTFLAKNINSLC